MQSNYSTPTLRNHLFGLIAAASALPRRLRDIRPVGRMVAAAFNAVWSTDHRDDPTTDYRVHHAARATLKKAELRAAIADVLAALDEDDRMEVQP